MLTRRIIPCLDIQGDRVVKGVGFKNLRDAVTHHGTSKGVEARYS